MKMKVKKLYLNGCSITKGLELLPKVQDEADILTLDSLTL